MLRRLRCSLLFFTRIPVGRLAGAPTVADAMPLFPVVGLVTAGATAGVYAALYPFVHPLVAAGCAYAANVAVTGAIHLDGLADVADGVGGGSQERRREIMADPAIGAFGAIALSLGCIIATAALGALSPANAAAALFAAHTLARSGSVVLLRLSRSASAGLGRRAQEDLGDVWVVFAVVFAALVSGLALGVWTVAAAGLAIAVLAFVAGYARRRLGGTTGDVLGAAEVLVEIGVVIVVGGVLNEGRLLWWS